MAKTTKKDNTLHDDYIVVNETEEWLQRNINQEFANGDFFRIVMFYILHSPCKKGSYNPVKLESYGWKNPYRCIIKSKHSLLVKGCFFVSDSFASIYAVSVLSLFPCQP